MSRTALESVRALLVEDDGRVRSTLLRVLTRRGCDVVEAESVAAARSALDGGGFDVVITDLGLGDGSGLEVVAHARRLDPATPVVILSGTIESVELEDQECVWRLAKPATTAELVDTVSIAHGARRARRASAAPVADPRSRRLSQLLTAALNPKIPSAA